MYVTFRQLSSKFWRSKTFAKTVTSKESFTESVFESTELTDPWTIRTIFADMMPAHLMSAAHSQTMRPPIQQTGLMEHSANMHVAELVNHGPLTLQVRGSHQRWNREHDHGIPIGELSSCLICAFVFQLTRTH